MSTFPRAFTVLLILFESGQSLMIERLLVRSGGREIQKREAVRAHKYSPQPKVLKVGHDDVVSILEGKILTLSCKAKGSPSPKIMWYKDNQPVTSMEGRVSVKSNSTGRTVKLKILRTSTDDAGNYTCRAENQNGFIKKWVYVAVESNVVPTERPTSAPVPTLTPKDEASPYTKRPEDPIVEICAPGYCVNGECYQGEDKKIHCRCSSPYGGPRCTLPHASPLPSHDGNKTTTPDCIGPDGTDCSRSVDRTLTYAGIGLAGIFLLIILGISWFMARQRRKDWRLWRRKGKSSYSSKDARRTPRLDISTVSTTSLRSDAELVIDET